MVVLFWTFCGCLLLMLTITVTDDEQKVQDQIKESLLKISSKATSAKTLCPLESYQNPDLSPSNESGGSSGRSVAILGVLDTTGYNPAQHSPKYETSYAQYIDEPTGANVKTSHTGRIMVTKNLEPKYNKVVTSSHISINPILNIEHTHIVHFGKRFPIICLY